MSEQKALTHLLTGQIDEAKMRATRIFKEVIRINEELLPPKEEPDSGKVDKPQPRGWFEETRYSLDSLLGTLHEVVMEIKRLTEAAAAGEVKRKIKEI